MSSTFTVAGVGSWSPILILADDVRHPARTVVHDLLAGGVAATLRPTAPRTGNLELLTVDAADAAVGVALLAAGLPVTLTADPAELSMRLVVTGEISLRTDTDTAARRVIITVPFREVPL